MYYTCTCMQLYIYKHVLMCTNSWLGRNRRSCKQNIWKVLKLTKISIHSICRLRTYTCSSVLVYNTVQYSTNVQYSICSALMYSTVQYSICTVLRYSTVHVRYMYSTKVQYSTCTVQYMYSTCTVHVHIISWTVKCLLYS